jgi:hypothetical protein
MYDLKKLRVGDRVVRGKDDFSKHLGIYLGIYSGQHIIAENNRHLGLSYVNFDVFLKGNKLERIEHFQGNEAQRRQIPRFIQSKIGTPYDLETYNPELFANAKQTPEVESPKLYRAVILGVLEYVWYRSFELQDA